MKFDFWTRGLCVFLFLLIASFLLTGCAYKIKGWSQEAYRSPDFDLSLLKEKGIALLPVIMTAAEPLENPSRTGQSPSAPYTPETQADQPIEDKHRAINNAYRIRLSETLLSKVKSLRPGLRVVSPGDCLKLINDAGLTARYLKFDREFTKVGVDSMLLDGLAQALDCRYIFISQAVVGDTTSEASITVVWKFGRKSVLQTLKISGQIWDTVSSRQIWEGSGVGYNRLSAYERAPLPEDVVEEAVTRLLETIMP